MQEYYIAPVTMPENFRVRSWPEYSLLMKVLVDIALAETKARPGTIVWATYEVENDNPT